MCDKGENRKEKKEEGSKERKGSWKGEKNVIENRQEEKEEGIEGTKEKWRRERI